GSIATDLDISLRTDLDSSIGTDLDISLRTDLDSSIGTDLDSSLRTDLDSSIGTDLDSSLRTDLYSSFGTDLVSSLRTDLDQFCWNRSSQFFENRSRRLLRNRSSQFSSSRSSMALRNTKAYKEYYAYASGEAAPKPKASARRKIGGSYSSTTPPTAVASPRPIIVVSPRLTAAAKGKQLAKAKSPSDPSELARTEAQQLKIVLKRSRQETHISQHGGSDTDEGTGSKPRVLDVSSDDSKEEIS
nr:hypothetical protein [Tanacetum cinerariifolium]